MEHPIDGTLPLARAIPLTVALLLAFTLSLPGAAWAADLRVRDVAVEPCPEGDAGRQPELRRPAGATCYVLRGVVSNPFGRPIVDTDVYAVVVDASGEAALPNRTRVGSIGDVPVGDSSFALRLSIPAGTPGPFKARNVKARGFNAPVRTRAGEDDELLPLERAIAAEAP
jgi:hypothetical protein